MQNVKNNFFFNRGREYGANGNLTSDDDDMLQPGEIVSSSFFGTRKNMRVSCIGSFYC